MSKAYILKGSSYLRYDVEADRVDDGYPKEMTAGWNGLSGTGFERDVDTVVDLGNGKAYLFKGAQYLRVDQRTNSVDAPVRAIADGWPGLAELGFADSIQAAANWGNGKLFLFRGDAYVRYDVAADRADDGYPLSIADQWPGLAEAGFAADLDAAIVWPNRKAFFFKGDRYLRYDVAADRADDGYPLSIADGWTGFAGAGYASDVGAAWVRLAAGAAPSNGGGSVPDRLGPGDHVWYYAGRMSTALDIPRLEWFPTADPNSATDYQNRGREIFNFVIHANGEIRRGRPHMLGHEGTFAWLDNNPGNITGVPGGAAYGAYPNKFNWHHFLIFPSYDAGLAAIVPYLRSSRYNDMSIEAAFRAYAPKGDGANRPEVYAARVAQAAGVTVDTALQSLNDEQMLLVRDAIVKMEGTVAGVALSPDSPELPEEIRSRL